MISEEAMALVGVIIALVACAMHIRRRLAGEAIQASMDKAFEDVARMQGQSVPAMPRPTPAARCQWCRAKLTRGECVDGCGGHQ